MEQDALVECPTGLVYAPLDVTQGVPPFEFDPNPLADFISSGCDSTTSSCVVRAIFQECRAGVGISPPADRTAIVGICLVVYSAASGHTFPTTRRPVVHGFTTAS